MHVHIRVSLSLYIYIHRAARSISQVDLKFRSQHAQQGAESYRATHPTRHDIHFAIGHVERPAHANGPLAMPAMWHHGQVGLARACAYQTNSSRRTWCACQDCGGCLTSAQGDAARCGKVFCMHGTLNLHLRNTSSYIWLYVCWCCFKSFDSGLYLYIIDNIYVLLVTEWNLVTHQNPWLLTLCAVCADASTMTLFVSDSPQGIE